MSIIQPNYAHVYTSLNDVVEYQAETRPDEVAYRFLDHNSLEQTLSCSELLSQVNQVANFLASQVVKGDRVILAAKPGLDFVVGFYACIRTGAIAVPIFPPANAMMATRFLHVVNDAKPKLILCDSEMKNSMRKGSLANNLLPGSFKRLVGINEILSELFTALKQQHIPIFSVEQACAERIDKRSSYHSEPEDAVFLQYTSGSTGNPRGVVLSHKNLLHNMAIIQRVLHHDHDSHMFSWLPPYHDMGLIAGILEPLFAGIPSTLMSTVDFIEHPSRWLKEIATYRCTTTGAPNFAFSLCAKRTPDSLVETLDLSCLKVAANGAEPISKAVIDLFYNKFKAAKLGEGVVFPCYGMAEATVMVAAKPYLTPEKVLAISKKHCAKNQVKLSHELHDSYEVLSSGVPQMDVVIVDYEQLKPAADNQIGEIWIRGDSVASGYYANEEKTRETFNNSLTINGIVQNNYLRSGDLGFLYEGELFVCGRLKNLIIINGQNYYPHDLEQAIALAHTALRSGCIVAYSEAQTQSTEKLILVAEIKASTSAEHYPEIIDSIRATITEQFQLLAHEVVLVKERSIPKTTSGKLQRIRCAELIKNKQITILHQYQHQEQKESNDRCAQTLTPWLPVLLATPEQGREALLCELIRSSVLSILNLSNDELTDLDQGFFTLGFNSLKLVELKSVLQKSFDNKIELDSSLIFSYPTIRELAKYLIKELELKSAETKPSVVSDSFYQNKQEEIAIIGVDGLFPGAKNLSEYWSLLEQGLDVLSEYPIKRWDLTSTTEDHQNILAELASTRAGIIDDISQFDAQFFNILPKTAEFIDPQHRLLLICVWKALENAGINPAELKGSNTGVFMGMSSHDYEARILKITSDHDLNRHVALGNAPSAATGRLAHFLGLQGPTMTIDTACSSSHVAVHEACLHLLNHECDLALAGGVNALLTPHLFVNFSKAGMLSKRGQCNTFDRDADGYIRGEGCGALVLKRFSDALRDKDIILATIKASGLNQDGPSSGLTVPNGNAQAALLEKVLRKAQLTPQQIDYIECHGTGTPLGDPIEVNALNQIYGSKERPSPLYIGSVKTNIGHLEAAAGIAGIIKTVMALQKERIPPNPHFHSLNPEIKSTPAIAVACDAIAWPKRENRRYAAVSGFGFSGTNAHLILGDAPEVKKTPAIAMPQYLFILSAKKAVSLQHLITAYRAYLSTTDEDLAHICYTLSIGRQHFRHRIAIIAKSKAELIEGLNKAMSDMSDVYSDTKLANLNDINEVQQAYLRGAQIDWHQFYQSFNTELRKVQLPNYCFDNSDYWLVAR